jgi:D-hexose-6-phosphate mutarotase
MKNQELNNKFHQFFGEEDIEEVKVDEVKEVVVNPITKSQKGAIMSLEEFNEKFKDIYETLK